nr:RNA-directed DNA polymerase, eukaryota, reverse transcriptase zinc-binding domain protein [Tanacetum cinerariifolium]
MGRYTTKEDDVAKISTSLFITNFPKSTSVKELFNACKQYGHVVDTFIPTKCSKAGKRFGFVRFINVFSVERLVNNLCTVWIDRLKLHANVARFYRASVNSHNHATQNFSGKFASLANLKMALYNEGFMDIKIQYMGEFWVLMEFVNEKFLKLFRDNVIANSWFSQVIQALDFVTKGRIAWVQIEGIPLKIWSDNTFKRIVAKWGELLDIDYHEETCFHSKRLCISLRIIETDDQYDDEIKNGGINGQETGNCVNSDAEEVPETAVDEKGQEENNADEESLKKTGDKLEDPFNIYPLLNKNNDNGMNNNASDVESDSICSGCFKKSKGPKTGGSILNLLDEVVKVRQVMGYKMDGYSFVMMRGVWRQSDKDVLLIAVYAPHDFKEKLLLWDYLNRPIRRWNREVIIMGYFDEGNGNEEIIKQRSEIVSKLLHIDKLSSVEMAQKAKVKWSIEGDENTSFFHGVINKKRNLLNIRGIMVDGSWVDEPSMVKREFFNHFRNRFDKPDGIRAITHMEYSRRISLDKQSELEGEVSNDEIKMVVWDCGTDKAPGSDGFTFGFYRGFWYLLDNDVYAAVKHFFIYGEIPKGCNSSFIALIPKIPHANLVKDFRPIILIESLYKIIAKILANRLAGVLGDIVNEVQSAFVADRHILDRPFILNEVIQWCKSKKKQSLVFKVDFEKAYDSVRWDFLDDILGKFGFGDKWRMWIQSCLKSSKVMESLHLSFQRVEEAKMFKGIKIGPTVTLSHVFYANDAVFVGKCNKASWVRWKKVLPFKDKDGLGVSSLYALNRGLLFKWIWRFYTQDKSLWVRVIKAMYGDKGKINEEVKTGSRSCWLNNVHEAKILTQKEKMRQPSLEFSFRRNTRGGVEQEQLGDLVTLMHDVSLSPMADRWALENSREFTVSSVRKHIDDKLILGVGSKTRWIKYVPIKVNVNAWKVKLDALPTGFNVSHRDLLEVKGKYINNSLWKKVMEAQAKKTWLGSWKQKMNNMQQREKHHSNSTITTTRRVHIPTRNNTLKMMKRRRARRVGQDGRRSRRATATIIERKVRTLKKLIPNGDSSVGLDGLFRETAEYISSLQLRVRLMQAVVDSCKMW